MPGSKRTFTYTLMPAHREDADKMARQARKILGWACEGDKRIDCHGVEGDALGMVQLSLTITGRDQWASRQVAQDILNLVTWGLDRPADLQLLSRRQSPHTSRGYAAGNRTKTWRDHGAGRDHVRTGDASDVHS